MRPVGGMPISRAPAARKASLFRRMSISSPKTGGPTRAPPDGSSTQLMAFSRPQYFCRTARASAGSYVPGPALTSSSTSRITEPACGFIVDMCRVENGAMIELLEALTNGVPSSRCFWSLLWTSISSLASSLPSWPARRPSSLA
jgi:hypothetical protein